MIETEGKVVAIEGEDALVEVQNNTGCSSCSSNTSCGQSLLSGLFNREKKPIRISNNIQAKVGENVIVAFEARSLQNLSFLIYGLPLLFLLLGGMLADTEPMSIGLGLLGMVIGLFVVNRISDKLSQSKHYKASLINIIH